MVKYKVSKGVVVQLPVTSEKTLVQPQGLSTMLWSTEENPEIWFKKTTNDILVVDFPIFITTDSKSELVVAVANV